jgi:hypothetical protein
MIACTPEPAEGDDAVCDDLPFSEVTGSQKTFQSAQEILREHDVWHHLYLWALGSCTFDGDLPDYDCQCETYFDVPDWGVSPHPDIYECNDWQGDVVACDVQRCTTEMQILVALSMATDISDSSYGQLCEDVAAESDRLYACAHITDDYYIGCFDPKGRVTH